MLCVSFDWCVWYGIDARSGRGGNDEPLSRASRRHYDHHSMDVHVYVQGFYSFIKSIQYWTQLIVFILAF